MARNRHCACPPPPPPPPPPPSAGKLANYIIIGLSIPAGLLLFFSVILVLLTFYYKGMILFTSGPTQEYVRKKRNVAFWGSVFMVTCLSLSSTLTSYLGSLETPIHHGHLIIGIIEIFAACLVCLMNLFQFAVARTLSNGLILGCAGTVVGFKSAALHYVSLKEYLVQIFGASGSFFIMLASLITFIQDVVRPDE